MNWNWDGNWNQHLIYCSETDKLRFFYFEMPLIVRFRPFSGCSAKLIVESFGFTTGLLFWKLPTKCKKYVNLVAIRKINFDDYRESRFAAMIFQKGGHFFLVNW